jgi:integrase
MTVHAECALWQPQVVACWTCEACLAADVDGSEEQPWDLSRAAGLLALARADGTVITYAASLRRFVALVQRSARRKGNTLSFADILPPGECAEVNEGAVLAFIGEAVEEYATATVEGTLAALTRWHKVKSWGAVSGPAGRFRVKEMMAALRRKHRGKVQGQQRAAYAMPVALVHVVVAEAMRAAVAAEKAGDLPMAYAHSRDALFYLVAFLGCLRKSEAIRLEGSDFTPGAIKGTVHLFIAFSKADQAGVGAVLPIACKTKSGLNIVAALQLHQRIMKARGVPAEGPLFGCQDKPLRRLASADSILRRLRHVYFPELAARGLEIPNGVRFSGHSFRRGGINAIRDMARAAGRDDASLRTLLMRYGRWRDERRLLVYLADNFTELARLTERL